MKKILLISLIFSSFGCFAQHTYPTVPLYGTAANSDRTYRSLQIGQATVTKTTVSNTPDTVAIIPGQVEGAGAVYEKNYFITVADTFVLSINNVGSSYIGSKMRIFLISANANVLVRFLGYSSFPTSQWALAAGATTVLLTANHYTVMTFISTGTAWVQQSISQD